MKPSELEILLFTKHLATMIKAGIPVAEGLETLVDQAKSKSFKLIVEDVLKHVKNGQPLAKSLALHPKAFDQFYVSLIGVSEESGTLDENLDFITSELSKNYNLKKKIQTAMLYPGLVFAATIIMGSFISFFVLPRLVDFFNAFDIALPITTRILLLVANLFKNYGIYIGVGAILVFSVFRALIQIPQIKLHWHYFLLKIPILGEFMANAQLAQFSRNLGVLLKSGVPVTRGIEVTSLTLSNLKFRNDLQEIGRFLSKGKNISHAMEKSQYFEFPSLVSKMIEVGEKTGKLDEALMYLGDFYEEEIDNASKNMTTILEPVLLIGIGLVVGFVALAIITPIYELTGSIRR